MDPALEEEIKKSGLQQVSAKDALQTQGAEKEGWIEAIARELASMGDLGVLSPVVASEVKGLSMRDVMPSMMLLGRKPVMDSPEHTKKARLVCCGNYTSKYAGEVSTHAVDAGTLRMILTMSERKSWSVSTADVATAFLRAEFLEDQPEYYMRVPPILVKLGFVQAGMIWRLKRPLYGLREAPRLWGIKRDKILRDLLTKSGFTLKQSDVDQSVWQISKDGELKGILATYVDDLMVCGDDGVADEIWEALAKHWTLKQTGCILPGEPGKLTYLGLILERREDKTLYCHQKEYVKDLLAKWSMKDCNPARLTGEPESFQAEKKADEGKRGHGSHGTAESLRDEDLTKKCQGIVGGLLWLSTRSRPDIAYQVGRAATLILKDPEASMKEAKHLLRYIKGTENYMLRLTPAKHVEPSAVGFVVSTDASFAPTGKNSPVGMIVQLWGCTVA